MNLDTLKTILVGWIERFSCVRGGGGGWVGWAVVVVVVGWVVVGWLGYGGGGWLIGLVVVVG